MNEQSMSQSIYGSTSAAATSGNRFARDRTSPTANRYPTKSKSEGDGDFEGAYAEELMELELQFNRKMESARRTDLDEKKTYRQRYLLEHSRQMEELQRLSNLKSVTLVEFFRKREEQLVQEFRRVLDLERLRWEGALAQKDDELRTLYLQQQQLAPPVRDVEVVSRRRFLPYFGLEIAEIPVQSSTDSNSSSFTAVKVISSTGPSAAAGVQPNDIIHQITIPVPVHSKANFLHALDKVDPGEKVHFAVGRDGKLEKMMITAESRGMAPPPPPSMAPYPGTTTMRTSSPYRLHQVYLPPQ